MVLGGAMDTTEKERWAAMEARLMERLDRLEAVLCRTSRSPSSSPTCSTTASSPSPPIEAPSRSTVSTAMPVAAEVSFATPLAAPASTTRPVSTLAISIPTTKPIAADTSISIPITVSDFPKVTHARCSMSVPTVTEDEDLAAVVPLSTTGASEVVSKPTDYLPACSLTQHTICAVHAPTHVRCSTPSLSTNACGIHVPAVSLLAVGASKVSPIAADHFLISSAEPSRSGSVKWMSRLHVGYRPLHWHVDYKKAGTVIRQWDPGAWQSNGFSQGNYEHRPELYMIVVVIWDPGIQTCRNKMWEADPWMQYKHFVGSRIWLVQCTQNIILWPIFSLGNMSNENMNQSTKASKIICVGQAVQLFQASVVFQGAALEVFEVLGNQSLVGNMRHWRGCKLPKPPWMVCVEVAESWFEQKLLTDGFLLEACPWCVLSMGFILSSALHMLKEVSSKEHGKQLLSIPVWIMSPVPWPILLCTRWELQHRMSWPPDRGEAACIMVVLQPRPCQLIKCSQHVVFVQLKAPWPPPRCMGLALIELDVLLAPWPPPVLWGCIVLSFRAYIVFSPTAGTQLELWNIIIGHAHDEGCKKIVQCKSMITTFRAVEMGEQASVHNALKYLPPREGELSIQSGEKYLAGSSWIIVIAQVKCTYHKEKMWFELSDGFIVAHGSESSGARFWLAENSTDVKCRALFHGRIVWQQRDIFQCWAHDLPHSGAVFCRLISVDYGAGLKRVAQNICKTMLDHTSIGDAINCSCITTLLTGQWPWDLGGYDNHPLFHWLMSKEAKNDWLSVHVLERKWATDNEQRGATDACQHVAWGQATFWRGGSVTPGPGDAL